MAIVVGAALFAPAAHADSRAEQVRYAKETVNLPYERFLDRKANFTAAGCNSDHKKKGGCTKPAPYNGFDWSSDGCSPPTLSSWKPLFNAACQLHDFGYRNFGKGLALGPDEATRAWIDGRFRTEMQRICAASFAKPWQLGNKAACLGEATIVWTFVHTYNHWPTGVIGQPAPAAPTPVATLPDQGSRPQPALTPVPDSGTPAPAAPPTWSETAGGVAHTWTNWTNAGGTEGASVPANATVAIACKLPGFRVADGNTWWYRIASSPWNGQYYVSADAFYNNGRTSGSLAGTSFVDGAVGNC